MYTAKSEMTLDAISSGSAKKPTVPAVQCVENVQVVESFWNSENGINPDLLAQHIVDDLEAAWNNSGKSLLT